MKSRYFGVVSILILFLFSLSLMAQTPPAEPLPPENPAPPASPISPPAPATPAVVETSTAQPVPAPAPAPTPTPTPTVTETSTAPTQPVAAPPPAKKDHRRLKRVLAVFEIEHGGKPFGTFKAVIHVDKAPKTAENFIGLAEGTKQFKEFDTARGKLGALTMRRFYDGLTFHRIVKDFVVQGGCPFGTGKGNPGYKIPDEVRRDLSHDTAGVLSMAREGNKKDSAGSQFFITLAPLKHLDGKATVFGKVVEGLDIVKKMAEIKRDPMSEKPVEPLVMKKVSIVREYVR